MLARTGLRMAGILALVLLLLAGHGLRRRQSTVVLSAAAAVPPDFRFIKVVAIIAFDRFEYFRQVIDGLRRAWGSDQYIVAITIDGPPQNETAFNRAGWQHIVEYSQQLQWLAGTGHGFKEVIINASAVNLGLWPNKKRAVAGAMALSDFVVVLEDDIVVSADALRWFEWHVTSGLIFARPNIAVATCWSSSFPYQPDAVEGHDLLAVHELGWLDKYTLNHWATPWGWAIWRRTWNAVGGDWNGRDIQLARLVREQGWHETQPLVARCNNIGSVGFHKKNVTAGHIHLRTITSASFPNLHQCAYTELERRNTTHNLALAREYFYEHVRHGIHLDNRFENSSLAELRDAMRQFVQQQPHPSDWQSSC